MAQAQSLTALRARTRRNADAEGVSALARHPDASVDDAIGLGVAALYRLIMESAPEQRLVTRSTFTTVAGTSLYILPSAVVRVLTVDVDENGYRRLLLPFELTDRPRLADPNAGYVGSPFGFNIQGQNIELLPVPTTAYTVTIYYVPEGPTLSAATDELLFDLRFDEYVALYAARELVMKDRANDALQVLTGRLAELESHVTRWARSRVGFPGKVRDVHEAGYPGRLGRPWRR